MPNALQMSAALLGCCFYIAKNVVPTILTISAITAGIEVSNRSIARAVEMKTALMALSEMIDSKVHVYLFIYLLPVSQAILE